MPTTRENRKEERKRVVDRMNENKRTNAQTTRKLHTYKFIHAYFHERKQLGFSTIIIHDCICYHQKSGFLRGYIQ